MAPSEAVVTLVLDAYIKCALWASTGDDCEPLDDDYGPDDVAPKTIAAIRAQVIDFLDDNATDLADLEPAMIGHDMFLTRNHHGAGFWDRGYGAKGERLTIAANAIGSDDWYVESGIVHSSEES